MCVFFNRYTWKWKICLCLYIYFHCWTIVLHGHFVQVSFAMDVFHCMKYFLQSAKKTSWIAQRVAQVTQVSQKSWGLPHLRNGIFVRFLNTQPSQCVWNTHNDKNRKKHLSPLPSKSVTTWQSLKKKELHLQALKKQISSRPSRHLCQNQNKSLLDTSLRYWCIMVDHFTSQGAFIVVSQTCQVQKLVIDIDIKTRHSWISAAFIQRGTPCSCKNDGRGIQEHSIARDAQIINLGTFWLMWPLESV